MKKDVLGVDAILHGSVNDIDILDAVAPVNYKEAKQQFFASRFSENPQFHYREREFSAFHRKRVLYALPVEKLKDPDLEQLYTDVVESYVDKLDQFHSIGTQDFLYDSLRYYGEPSKKDIANARFILHLPEEQEENTSMVDADGIAKALDDFGKLHGYRYTLNIVDAMIANALVSGDVVKVNRSAKINATELSALAHHELGVHLVTTLNARAQPLKILSLGSPVNTTTQEGIAILCEYLSGNLTLNRLMVLALRVLAVQSMLIEKDFKQTFLMLKEQFDVADDLAFTICARVYRGGGFTKDYLYLKGFHHMLNAFESEANFNYLLCGKVSLEHLPLISRLIGKEYLQVPQYISPAIQSPSQVDDVHRFVAHAIK